MPNDPPKRRGLRARFDRYSVSMVDTQLTKVRLLLAGLPGMLIFLAAGASPMVVIDAGLAIGLIAMGPRLLPRSHRDNRDPRAPFLAGSGLLALACGVQVVAWRLGLDERAASALTIVGALAILGLLLLREGVRWLVKRLQGRFDPQTREEM